MESKASLHQYTHNTTSREREIKRERERRECEMNEEMEERERERERDVRYVVWVFGLMEGKAESDGVLFVSES